MERLTIPQLLGEMEPAQSYELLAKVWKSMRLEENIKREGAASLPTYFTPSKSSLRKHRTKWEELLWPLFLSDTGKRNHWKTKARSVLRPFTQIWEPTSNPPVTSLRPFSKVTLESPFSFSSHIRTWGHCEHQMQYVVFVVMQTVAHSNFLTPLTPLKLFVCTICTMDVPAPLLEGPTGPVKEITSHCKTVTSSTEEVNRCCLMIN